MVIYINYFTQTIKNIIKKEEINLFRNLSYIFWSNQNRISKMVLKLSSIILIWIYLPLIIKWKIKTINLNKTTRLQCQMGLDWEFKSLRYNLSKILMQILNLKIELWWKIYKILTKLLLTSSQQYQNLRSFPVYKNHRVK